jgi:hypothetical protein
VTSAGTRFPPIRSISAVRVTGWGLNLSSNVKFLGKDVIRLQFTYGAGIENYFNDAPIDVGAEANFGNSGHRLPAKRCPLSERRPISTTTWNPRVTTADRMVDGEHHEQRLQTPAAYHNGQYASVNLLWTPVTNVLMGGEFQYGRRLNKSDEFSFNDYRLQFSFKYSFSQHFRRTVMYKRVTFVSARRAMVAGAMLVRVFATPSVGQATKTQRAAQTAARTASGVLAPADIQRALNAAYEQVQKPARRKERRLHPRRSPRSIQNLFGIALVTPDGQIYTAGDTTTEVSIQSISKVFTLARILPGLPGQGRSQEHRRGRHRDAFNSIIAIEQKKGFRAETRSSIRARSRPLAWSAEAKPPRSGRESPTRTTASRVGS